ncbi:acyl-CoA dehydrogenase family protein [Longivirga aurantiaca]|uniref:Acyl-CoA dehydrogenase family protein n=1 Tax=Longivirga aurantiaca TaxID=1837743 RepID=A0ABW1T5H3_9ACTN
MSTTAGALLLTEPTDELRSMAEAVRSVLAAESPIERVAAVADGLDGLDAPLWRTLAQDLGVTGVLVPEAHGGLGLGWAEARVVLEALGSSLACVPFAPSCVVAVTLVLAAGDEGAAGDILPGIVDGSTVVAVALGDDSVLAPVSRSAVAAELGVDGAWVLTGDQPFVPYGTVADAILLLARTSDDEHGWFLVASDARGLSRSAMSVVDTTRPQALLRLESTPARLVGAVGRCDDLLAPVLDAAVAAAACEQLGASRHLLDLTVAYASTRFQFGQPIGSFQALQHRLADLAISIDTAASAVEYAVSAAPADPRQRAEAASISGVVCSETFYLAALETIQIHGGIGFTWEHQAHRYYRRALASRVALGSPAFHRERLLQSLAL